MKKIYFQNATKVIFLLCLFCTNIHGQNARIKIDIERTVGEVNKNIYGNFVEHLGRCVYGGIYDPG
jgi:alpha-N-arabinofuranosidase